MGLNELAKVNFVNLIWVPGHSGILGNEKADNNSRVGAIHRSRTNFTNFI